MRKRLAGLSLFISLTSICGAATTVSSSPTQARRLIEQPIVNSERVALKGSIHPGIHSAKDLGVVSDDFAVGHIILLLRRSAEREADLNRLIEDQANPNSENYHRWLSPQEFGERFGASQADLDAISDWLVSSGFTINQILSNRVAIDFSASAGQLRRHLALDIHYLMQDGAAHYANINEPKIPAALAPAVLGIVQIGNTRAATGGHANPAYTGNVPSYPYDHFLAPADIATVYNLNPLYQSGYHGEGQIVAEVGYSNPGNVADWDLFRSTYGLSQYAAPPLQIVHPGCVDPGVVAGDFEFEATLDAQMITATAPAATVWAVSCANSGADGLLLALQGLVASGGSHPDIITFSYQTSIGVGTAYITAITEAYRQAAVEGTTVFAASGDLGATVYQVPAGPGTFGIQANAFASTIYNVAVGGTQLYGAQFFGAGPTSTAWNSANSAYFGSALSYIPELPWNRSCASAYNSAAGGHPNIYGANSMCNDPNIDSRFKYGNLVGGGAPGIGVVKPFWQSGIIGNPADGARDTPDVSLAAENIVYCDSSSSPACGAQGLPKTAYGTSASSPLLAGIQALINQKTASRWGNTAPILYSLATQQYGTSGDAACDSNSGNPPASRCIFYDITLGDNEYPCQTGSPNCFSGNPAAGSYGVLSQSTTAYVPAYPATRGWDFATGIGSVNAYNLANSWPKPPPLSPAILSIILSDDCDPAVDSTCSQ